jgi:hypothetical protein
LSGSGQKKQSRRRRWLRRDLRVLPYLVRPFCLLRRCERPDADDVLGKQVLLSSVALGGDVRSVVDASYPVLLGDSVSAKMGGEGDV